jgi:hypothetical protein
MHCPLPWYLAPDPVKIRPAVMQSEILVEAAQPAADCPLWKKCLLGSPENYLQRQAGYTITGYTNHQ